MSLIASNAQYFYYSSIRIGICLPIITGLNKSQLKCGHNDINALAQLVGIDYSIQGQLINCEEFNPDKSLDIYQIISM